MLLDSLRYFSWYNEPDNVRFVENGMQIETKPQSDFWQNTFHKVLARTGLRMAYTLGFNPTMKVSMGIALPLFAESEGELVDIEILDNLTPQEIMDIEKAYIANKSIIWYDK